MLKTDCLVDHGSNSFAAANQHFKALDKAPTAHLKGMEFYEARHLYSSTVRWKTPYRAARLCKLQGKEARKRSNLSTGEFVYYVKVGLAGIWKIPVGGGNETEVLSQGQQMDWALADKG